LFDQIHGKNRGQHIGRHRLSIRTQWRIQLDVCQQVIPLPRDFRFRQKYLPNFHENLLLKENKKAGVARSSRGL
jgi:hypothetical protein